MTARRLLGPLAALVLAGCATSGATAAPTVPAPTTISTEAAVATPSAKPRLYPYVLPWPETEMKTTWRYASTPWDGNTRIDHGNGSTDWTKTLDGDLFAFGFATIGSAADIQAETAEQANEWHGCDLEPLEEAPLSGGGEPGILAIHDCNGQRVIRWFAVHDGFGLRVMLILAADADEGAARSHFEAAVAALTWID